jgi:hypothetical protein
VKPLSADQKLLVDEYGECRRALASVKPISDRATALASIINGWVADSDADAGYIAGGNRYDIHISPRAKQRRVKDMGRLFRLLGRVKFLTLCKVGVETIERELPLAEHGKVLVQERTGPRRLEPVAKMFPLQSESGVRIAA